MLLLLCAPLHAATVDFAGYTWTVRAGTGGPGPNRWSDAPESVWVDADGALHLTIRRDADGWTSSEVYLGAPTRHGVHRFHVDTRFDQYDPNVVLGLFTYQDDNTEIDVELAKWGDPDGDTTWFTVQPPSADRQRSYRPELGGSYTTHQFDWQPGSVHFQSWHGHYDAPPDSSWVIGDWTCTDPGIPGEDAAMPVHMNLWLMGGAPPTDEQEVEVIVRHLVLPGDRVDTGTTDPVDTATTDTGPPDTGPTDTAPVDTDPTDTGTSPTDPSGTDTGSPAPPADGCGCAAAGAGGLVQAAAGVVLLGRRRKAAPPGPGVSARSGPAPLPWPRRPPTRR